MPLRAESANGYLDLGSRKSSKKNSKPNIARCIYLSHEGYCELHSDGIDFREPCVGSPCSDAKYE